MDALYHQASVKIGLSDSTVRVLYTICDNGESCLLSDVYKLSGINKQTINSAVRKLETDEMIYLEKYNGRTKKVFLTEKGKRLAEKTVVRILEMENDIFSAWSEEDFNRYIAYIERFVSELEESVGKM